MSDEQDGALLQQLGGQPGVRAWVDRFYDRIARNAVLAPLFPEDLTASRDKQFAYFVQIFGGPPLYQEQYGRAFMRFRHRHVRIGRTERDEWMAEVMAALRETVGEEPDLLNAVEERLASIATAMINYDPERKDAYYFN